MGASARETHFDVVLFYGITEEFRKVCRKIYQAGGPETAVHAVG